MTSALYIKFSSCPYIHRYFFIFRVKDTETGIRDSFWQWMFISRIYSGFIKDTKIIDVGHHVH